MRWRGGSPSCATRAASRCSCTPCRCPARRPRSLALDALAVPTYARIESAIRGLDAVLARSIRRRRPTRRRRPRRRSAARPTRRRGAPGRGRARRSRTGTWPTTTPRPGRIAARLGAPVALKAVAPSCSTRRTPAASRSASPPAMRCGPPRRCGPRVGMALDGVFVERMAANGGVDLVVGARRDPTFGPVVLVGVGGIFVETLDDVIVTLAPADPGTSRALLRTLRAWPLLAGRARCRAGRRRRGRAGGVRDRRRAERPARSGGDRGQPAASARRRRDRA